MDDKTKDDKPKTDDKKLIRLTQAEVDAIVHKHESYSLGRMGGVRANFSYHDLSNLSLAKRDLSDANFTGASLYEADLQGTKFDRAILFCSDMRFANLYGASLLRADM